MMREHDETYELDDVYALMMDALDGELTANQNNRLMAYLDADPALAAEWASMQVVDTLFTEAPIIEPSVDFTARTVARLPNLRLRRLVTGSVFLVTLLVGLIPVVATALIMGLVAVDGVAIFWQTSSVVFEAIGQILLSLGNTIGEQPAIMGVFLLMAGSITLWAGLYQQLVTRPAVIAVSA